MEFLLSPDRCGDHTAGHRRAQGPTGNGYRYLRETGLDRSEIVGRRRGRRARRRLLFAGPGLELADEVVEVEPLKLAGDGIELALAVLDERLALAAELERLAQLGLAGVEPDDDLLEPLDGGLVAARLRVRFSDDDVLAEVIDDD